MRSQTVLAVLLSSIVCFSVVSTHNYLTYPSVHAAGSTQPTISVVSSRGLPTNRSDINDPTLGVGTTFKVNVNVTNAVRLFAFDITLNFAVVQGIKSVLQVQTPTDVTTTPGLFNGTSLPSGCRVLPLANEVFGDPDTATIHIARSMAGGCSVGGDGILYSVTFTVFDTGSTTIDVLQTKGGRLQELLIGPGPGGVGHVDIPNIQVANAIFQNIAGTRPGADFTYSPAKPNIGDTVTFDGSKSADPDSPGTALAKYYWTWGDTSPTGLGKKAIETHEFLATGTVPTAGYFQVKLVVQDSDQGLYGSKTMVVFVNPTEIHDVAVDLNPDKTEPTVGETVHLTVTVYNQGNRDENVSLTLTYDYNGATQIGKNSSFLVRQNSQPVQFTRYTIDTTSLPVKQYIVKAEVKLNNATAVDPTPSDNVATKTINVRSLTGGNNPFLTFGVATLAIAAVAALGAIGGATFLVRRRRKGAEQAEDQLS